MILIMIKSLFEKSIKKKDKNTIVTTAKFFIILDFGITLTLNLETIKRFSQLQIYHLI